jgi:hypothetical protein
MTSGRFKQLSRDIAKNAVLAAYYADGAVRHYIAGIIEEVLDRAFEEGAQNALDGDSDLIAALRTRVNHLETLCEQVGIDVNGVLRSDSHRVPGEFVGMPDAYVGNTLLGIMGLAVQVANSVAGEHLLEIWWARGGRGIVVVSAVAEDITQPMPDYQVFRDANLLVAVLSPNDMRRLRAGELELPDRFLPPKARLREGIVLDKLYSNETPGKL